ncbi:MAG: SPFH domain-containing protein [Planctomycetota bacterium]|jgi:flotillin
MARTLTTLTAVSSTELFTVAGIFLAAMVFFQVILYASRFKRCPSDKVLVVFGKVRGSRSARCIHGGGVFVWPLFQDYAYLDLDPMTITLPFKEITRGKSKGPASLKVMVAIGTEPAVMKDAAERLLGLKPEQIETTAKEIVLGRLRSEVESFGADRLANEMDAFLVKAREALDAELGKVGMFAMNLVDTGYAG